MRVCVRVTLLFDQNLVKLVVVSRAWVHDEPCGGACMWGEGVYSLSSLVGDVVVLAVLLLGRRGLKSVAPERFRVAAIQGANDAGPNSVRLLIVLVSCMSSTLVVVRSLWATWCQVGTG